MKRSYTINGRTIELDVDEDVIAVRYKKETPNSTRAQSVENPAFAGFESRVELPLEEFVIIPLSGPSRNAAGLVAASQDLVGNQSVERVAQVFRTGNKRIVATDRILVGLSEGNGVEDILERFKLEVLETFGNNEYLMRLDPGDDPIDIVEELNAFSKVRYAEPDFVTFGSHIARRSAHIPSGGGHIMRSTVRRNDPLAREQYAVYITEADLAWQIAKGSPDVRIAILDEGVDVLHPDLKDAIVGNYDATDDDSWQEPNGWDAHGTACAGLAAAVHSNGEGIMGIGGGCSILAVRIAYSTAPGRDWVVRNHWIVRAVDWCTRNGADVLSNSWGGGAFSQSIVDAFERARTHGRDGKGSVIVLAAGNDSRPVDFPGNQPNYLTVSASNEFDEFKTRNSRDGEHWWGSNFGPEVDLAAPGVHNLTTDNTGVDGYGTGDYADFNGTSSSCPIVAGACALLVSINPELTEAEVRDIVAKSSDKVGQFPYSGGRNDQMGQGRLNVNTAVDRVLSTLTS